MTYTLALAQCVHPADGNVVAQVRSYARQAADQGADLLVFPESLMTPYEKEKGAFLAEAEPLNGPFALAVDAIAQEYGLWMVYTVNEKNQREGAANRNPFNTAVVVDPAGKKQGVHRKTHLFDTDFTKESDRMASGDALFTPIDTPFCRLGVGICYDLRFPEVARHAALAGANLMLYPAAWVDGPGKADHWRTLLRARAIENEMFVAGVCRADAGRIGQSLVAGPRGEVIAQAGRRQQLLVTKVDNAEIETVRAAMPVFDHRRPELY